MAQGLMIITEIIKGNMQKATGALHKEILAKDRIMVTPGSRGMNTENQDIEMLKVTDMEMSETPDMEIITRKKEIRMGMDMVKRNKD